MDATETTNDKGTTMSKILLARVECDLAEVMAHLKQTINEVGEDHEATLILAGEAARLQRLEGYLMDRIER